MSNIITTINKLLRFKMFIRAGTDIDVHERGERMRGSGCKRLKLY
jgi:hypothetical protein